MLDPSNKAVPGRELIYAQGAVTSWEKSDVWSEISIDWSKKDTPAMHEYYSLRKQIFDKVNSDAECKRLRDLSTWSESDREKWERKLTEMTIEICNKSKIFGSYRDDLKTYNTKPKYNIERNFNNVNETSVNNCDNMSFLKVMLMQEAEDKFLSEFSSGEKYAGQYFYVQGDVFFNYKNGGPHSFIAGRRGIIESTSQDPLLAYQTFSTPDYEFRDLIAGTPARVTNKDGGVTVYTTGYYGTKEQTQVLCDRKSILVSHNVANEKLNSNILDNLKDTFSTAAYSARDQGFLEKIASQFPERVWFDNKPVELIRGVLLEQLNERAKEFSAFSKMVGNSELEKINAQIEILNKSGGLEEVYKKAHRGWGLTEYEKDLMMLSEDLYYSDLNRFSELEAAIDSVRSAVADGVTKDDMKYFSPEKGISYKLGQSDIEINIDFDSDGKVDYQRKFNKSDVDKGRY